MHDAASQTLGQLPAVTPAQISALPIPVSVVILTRNEEANIADCLATCDWCDDVHVIDSGSTDRTMAIARERGAAVHEHAFSGFGEQRNWAIDHASCKHRWQFHLDADERFTPGLVAEIRHILDKISNDGPAAYLVPSKMMFSGTWLRYSSGYPVYQVRLIDSQRTRFVDVGHGQREQTDGPIGTLREPYIHFGFSRGLAAWFRKHNGYSDKEAAEAIRELVTGSVSGELRDLFAGNRVGRRRAIKRLSYRMRGRRQLRFFLQYILRGGFRDGSAGLSYARLISMYEWWIEAKIHGDLASLSLRLAEVIEAAVDEVGTGRANPIDTAPFTGDYHRMVAMLRQEDGTVTR